MSDAVVDALLGRSLARRDGTAVTRGLRSTGPGGGCAGTHAPRILAADAELYGEEREHQHLALKLQAKEAQVEKRPRRSCRRRDLTYAGDETINDERSEHSLRRPACTVGAGAQSRAEDHEARRGEHAAAGGIVSFKSKKA